MGDLTNLQNFEKFQKSKNAAPASEKSLGTRDPIFDLLKRDHTSNRVPPRPPVATTGPRTAPQTKPRASPTWADRVRGGTATPNDGTAPARRQKSRNQKPPKPEIGDVSPPTRLPRRAARSVHAPAASTREHAKADVINELTRMTAPQCNQIGAPSVGPKFFVDACILGTPVRMLVDSGSQVNILPASSCPKDILGRLSRPPTTVTAYNGSVVDILGTFETDIVVGDLDVVRTTVYVTNNAFRPILGTPALRGLTLDFEHKTLRNAQGQARLESAEFDGPPENLNLRSAPGRTPERKLQLYCQLNTTLAPRSETLLPVRVQNGFKGYGLFMTEPNSCLIPNASVAKSVACYRPHARSTIIRVLNPTSEAIHLSRRQSVVSVSAVDAIAPAQAAGSKALVRDVTIGDVPDPEKRKLEALLHEYADVFASDRDPLTQTDQVTFDVDTGDSPPVAQQKYRTPYFLRSEMRQIIDKNIETGLMREISSPWAAPTLLVRKASGAWRLVVDYRKLNSVTTVDSYPLPEIADCVQELAESRYFSTTDLCSGFHQIPTTSEAQKKLAVVTDFGQFTWLRMPMGARNCPAVFQRMMDGCFRTMPLSTLVIYLDDILLHTRTLQEHHTRLREMFQILRKNCLKVRADKTVIATKEVNFCGFTVKEGVKRPNRDKVKAVRQLPSPKSTKEAQSVFGLLNYFRAFIPSFAKKAHAITDAYRAKRKFTWSHEAEQALQTLKNEVCDATLQLRIPSLKTAHFVLETDACDSGYAGALYVCKHAHEPSVSHSSVCAGIESSRNSPKKSKYRQFFRRSLA